MVKCPICGLDDSPEEYVAHYDSHGVGARVEVGEELDNLLQAMGRGVKARDFDYFVKAGMEALVELGILIGLKNTLEYTVEARSGVYNNLAIAILSAHMGDWEEARKFLNKAIYELGRIEMGFT